MIKTFRSLQNKDCAFTAEELQHVSRQVNAAYQPRFSSILSATAVTFSSAELLTISQEISCHNKMATLAETFQNNLSLLPIDPRHVHAFWNIGQARNEVQSLALHIQLQRDLEDESDLTEKVRHDVMEININDMNSNMTIELPDSFSAKICAAQIVEIHNDEKQVLLTSSPVQMPIDLDDSATDALWVDALFISNPSGINRAH